MSDDVQHPETEVNRYEGWRGTLRILGEAFAEVPSMLKEDLQEIASKLRGEGTVDGESCGMSGCERDSVSMYEWRDNIRDDTPICRRHWIILSTATLVVQAAVYGAMAAMVALGFWLVITA